MANTQSCRDVECEWKKTCGGQVYDDIDGANTDYIKADSNNLKKARVRVDIPAGYEREVCAECWTKDAKQPLPSMTFKVV